MNETDWNGGCQNAFSERNILTTTQATIIGSLQAVLIPFIISINFTLAYAMYKTKLLNSRMRWYVFLLTISDGLYGITSVPLMAVLFIKYAKTTVCNIEFATIFLMQFNMNVSLYFILLIAFHRYLKLDPELKSRNFIGLKKSAMSGRLANFLVAMCYFSPVVHATTTTNIFGQWDLPIPNMVMKLANLTMLFIGVVLYFRLYYRIVKRSDKVASANMTASQGHQNHYTKQVTKTVLIILITLAASFVPFIVFDAWTSLYTYMMRSTAPQTVRFLYYFSLVLLSTVCISDAIIFIYRNKKIKEYIYNKMWSKVKEKFTARNIQEETGSMQAAAAALYKDGMRYHDTRL